MSDIVEEFELTEYPGSIDIEVGQDREGTDWEHYVDLEDYVKAKHVNILQDSILAIQNTLGTNPQGDYSTVVDRLDELRDDFEDHRFGQDHDSRYGGIGWDSNQNLVNHTHSGAEGGPARIDLSSHVSGELSKDNINLDHDSEDSLKATDITVSSTDDRTIQSALANKLSKDGGVVDGTITADRFISSVSSGTPPFTINSDSVVDNLNVDMLDGYHADDFMHTDSPRIDAAIDMRYDIMTSDGFVLLDDEYDKVWGIRKDSDNFLITEEIDSLDALRIEKDEEQLTAYWIADLEIEGDFNAQSGATVGGDEIVHDGNIDPYLEETLNSAKSYADDQAQTAQSNAESYAEDVADTAEQNAKSYTDDHENSTSGVHGVGNSDVESVDGAQSKADSAESSAKSYTDDHANSNGTSHVYINQDVTSSASPTFNNLNIDSNIYMSSNSELYHGSQLIIDEDGKVHNAVYNDMAEFMECIDYSVEPGDILIETGDGLSKCETPRDRRVIGVYSDTYGFALGGQDKETTHMVPVGLSGRVLVKAEGIIEPGDLLVAGSKPGYASAIKGNPTTGTVIGKALERFDDTKDGQRRVWALIMNA